MPNSEDEEINPTSYSSSSSCSPCTDNNPRPNQNRRLIPNMTPFNNQLSTHVLFTNPRFKEISLCILELDKAIHNKLNFKYVNLQLIQLITSNESSANVYWKKKWQGQHLTIKFTCLI